MTKLYHEIRDPVHDFIKYDGDEKKVLNSRPFQRLRHIHQLSLSFLVYPGATHRRFEHSLGVMEVATRIFDIVTDDRHLPDEIRELFLRELDDDRVKYWRRVLRMAALCHDLGHLPFSHGAEDLLPGDWSHERLSAELILSAEMTEIWRDMRPPLDPEDIAKVAVGKKYVPNLDFSDWETILSEIVTHDVFGADRIDYLLRDSHHAGVAYGVFDHYRLIDTIRILPPPPAPPPGAAEQLNLIEPTEEDAIESDSVEPSLGVEKGGLRTAEALLLARFFMYSQVYFHPVRRMYDQHLREFLKETLEGGTFRTDAEAHLEFTDNEITAKIREVARNPDSPGHDPARRIVERRHLKVAYEVTPEDLETDIDATEKLHDELADRYDNYRTWYDDLASIPDDIDFPVWYPRTSKSKSAVSLSEPLRNIPAVKTDRLYADSEIRDEAEGWLEENHSRLLTR